MPMETFKPYQEKDWFLIKMLEETAKFFLFYIPTPILAYLYLYLHTYIYTYTYTNSYVHLYLHIYTYTYICRYVHPHLQTPF